MHMQQPVQVRLLSLVKSPRVGLLVLLSQQGFAAGKSAQNIGAEDFQADGFVGDALVHSRHSVGLVLDLLPYQLKVCEALACSTLLSVGAFSMRWLNMPRIRGGTWHVQELAPFLQGSFACLLDLQARLQCSGPTS